ncbi:MAG: hypothetical protein JJE02_06930 [Propionibacteriales bacterium]|nr:hypothetical protein [Propionibacteriales bacterium]
MRFRWLLIAALGAAFILGTVALRDRTPIRSEYCTAEVGGTVARVDLEQAQWSALMAAIASRRGMPARAATIAIATAFQESKIHNIGYGDRDSVGIFQQRPSQGWGTAEQISDPHYSIGRFYDGLAKIRGYSSMEITEAAQKVQRSAFPGAYAQHEDDARALASSLAGYSTASFTCQINPKPSAGNIRRIAGNVNKAYGELSHKQADGRIAYTFTGKAADVERRGWSLAHYLVANAASLGIETVSFNGRKWTASDSPEGWQTSTRARSDVVTATID